MVHLVALAVWKITLMAPAYSPGPPPIMLQDVFNEWGCTWLWEDLQWKGDETWIPVAIQWQTCILVADGSYMSEVCPDLCSTAFFFECTAGSGKLVGSFVDSQIWPMLTAGSFLA